MLTASHRSEAAALKCDLEYLAGRLDHLQWMLERTSPEVREAFGFDEGDAECDMGSLADSLRDALARYKGWEATC